MPTTEFALRPWSLNDLDSLVKYANNPNVSKYTSDGFPYPYTVQDAKKFLKAATSEVNKENFWLAIAVSNKAVGGIGFMFKKDINRCNMEIGYWLGEPFWGKGIITTAIRDMVIIGFNKYPDIQRIYGSTFGQNIASQKTLLNAGLTQEARIKGALFKNNVFDDDVIFGIRRDDMKLA